jgi:hypothetical protein
MHQYLKFLKPLFLSWRIKDPFFSYKICFYEQHQMWLFCHALKISFVLIHSHWFSLVLIHSHWFYPII